MLARGFAAGPWATNCFVIAPGPSSECVVVDPGKDSLDGIAQIVAEYDLHPVAALLTHGHIDHTWSVMPLCASHDIPAMIHVADRHQLSDPLSGLSVQTGGVIGMMAGTIPEGEPRDVRLVADGDSVTIAGLPLTVRHTPGHTPGSIVFVTHDDVQAVDVMLSGDLLFAGSVGRTDLPGGSWPELMASLNRVALPMADETIVLPGHGASTTIGAERAANPYLAEAATAAPARGL